MKSKQMQTICPNVSFACLEKFNFEDWPSIEEVLLATDEVRAILDELRIILENDARSSSLAERKELRKAYRVAVLAAWEWQKSLTVRSTVVFVKEILADYIDRESHRLRIEVSTGELIAFARRPTATCDRGVFVLPKMQIDVDYDTTDGQWLFLIAGRPVFQCGPIRETGLPPVFAPRHFLNAFVALAYASDVLRKLPADICENECGDLENAIRVIDDALKPSFENATANVDVTAEGEEVLEREFLAAFKGERQRLAQLMLSYPQSATQTTYDELFERGERARSLVFRGGRPEDPSMKLRLTELRNNMPSRLKTAFHLEIGGHGWRWVKRPSLAK